MADPTDCPALHERGDSYPFGDKVPRTVRMRKTVVAYQLPVPAPGELPSLALIGQLLPAWTSSDGTVAVDLPDGNRLGIKPHEFEVAEWHSAGLPGEKLPPIDMCGLIVEIDTARRKFLACHPADPRVVVFPESRRGQPVTWDAVFPKRERRTDALGPGLTILGMAVRFSADAHEVACQGS